MEVLEASASLPLLTNPGNELSPKRSDLTTVSPKTPSWVDKARAVPDEFYANPPCTD